jgi:molybdopterin synthase catalytic subunit
LKGQAAIMSAQSGIRVQTETFDVAEVIDGLRAGNPAVGAIVSFIGLVRDLNDGANVETMTLEHYPGMTEKALQGIVTDARKRWDLVDVSVVHRVGELHPTDPIVLVAVASAHRGDAFQACEFIMDFLKTRAPFWKKEEDSQGTRWVASRSSDARAAGRWKA